MDLNEYFIDNDNDVIISGIADHFPESDPNLYPKVNDPVQRDTPSLSSLINCDHQESYLVTNSKSKSDIRLELDFKKPENQYLFDHFIDGRPLFPAIGYLMLVWEELAKQQSMERNQMSVLFENVQFLSATILPKEGVLKFILNINRISGEFQMFRSDVLVVTGYIRQPIESEDFLPLRQRAKQMAVQTDCNYRMSSQDFYKELRIRGYDYRQEFQTILSLDLDKNRAKLRYNDNLIAFIDGLIQLQIIDINTRDLYLPASIEFIHCDPRLLDECVDPMRMSKEVEMSLSGNYCLTYGLEIYGLVTTQAIRRKPTEELLIEKYVWIPYMDMNALQNEMNLLIDSYVELIDDIIGKNLLNGKTIKQINILLNINGMTTESLVLKNILYELYNNSEVQPTIDENILATDLLNELYFNDSLLRPAIDVILENTDSIQANSDYNVLEMNFTHELCYHKIMAYLKDSFTGLKIKYSVYNPLINKIKSDSEKNLYEKIDLNFSKPESNLDTNLVIIRTQLPTKVVEKGNDRNDIDFEAKLKYVYNQLNTNGFLLIFNRFNYTKAEKTLFQSLDYHLDRTPDQNQLISMANKIGFSLISHRSDGRIASVLLFRKVDANQSLKPIIINVSNNSLNKWVDGLKTVLITDPLSETPVWLVSDGKEPTGLVGFVNCLRREPGGHRIRCISMDESLNGKPFKRTIFNDNLVMNVYKSDQLGSYRHLNLNESLFTKDLVRNAEQLSHKSTLEWFESKHNLWPKRYFTKRQNILIDVCYVGLNPTDLMANGTGISVKEKDSKMGLCSEFSGFDESGNRVFGVKSHNSLATTLVFNNPKDLIPVPKHWTLAEACSVPLAYGTAYLALAIRAPVNKNNSILVMGADSYVGRAAIAVCLSIKCNIYATVHSIEAMNALLTEFPNLIESQIINTSMDSIQQIIIENTSGLGVDVVFDTTNQYSIQTGMACLRPNGIYLYPWPVIPELNGKGVKNIRIERIDFESLFSDCNELRDESIDSIKYKIFSLIEKGINESVVKPFNTTVYPMNHFTDGLDSLTIDRQTNKILTQLRSEKFVKKREELLVIAYNNTQFLNDRMYIITGGLGGFGLELANWLVERGARHLMLTSRSGVKTHFQEFCIERLRKSGAQVVISILDASDDQQCLQLLREASRMTPIAGIFCLAMVLNDSLFENQTADSMERVFRPKVNALKNLDLISRELCPELEYFVAFSSVTSGRGNAGQTNYGYANSYMERVCEQRLMDGKPGLAIQWGAIADVGVVSELFAKDNSINKTFIGGTVPQRIHSCLQVLNHFLRSKAPVVSSLLRMEPKVINFGQTRDVIVIISEILGIKDSSKIRTSAKLPELGMDSLMIVEINQALNKEFQIQLTLKELADMTVADIIKINK